MIGTHRQWTMRRAEPKYAVAHPLCAPPSSCAHTTQARVCYRAAMQHHKLPILNFRSDWSVNPDRKMRVAGLQV
eukprot:11042-Eustigmatos_ZCMA.PRE.1